MVHSTSEPAPLTRTPEGLLSGSCDPRNPPDTWLLGCVPRRGDGVPCGRGQQAPRPSVPTPCCRLRGQRGESLCSFPGPTWPPPPVPCGRCDKDPAEILSDAGTLGPGPGRPGPRPGACPGRAPSPGRPRAAAGARHRRGAQVSAPCWVQRRLLTARAGKVQPETAGRRHPNAVPGWLAGAAGTLLGVPSEIGLRAARRPTRGPAGARRSRAGGRTAARPLPSLPEHRGGKGRTRTHVLSLGAAGPGPHVCNPPPDPGRKVGGPKGKRRPGDCEDAAG